MGDQEDKQAAEAAAKAAAAKAAAEGATATEEQKNSKGWEAAKAKEEENAKLRAKLREHDEAKAKADEEAAKKRGEWQTLAEKHEADALATKAALRQEQVRNALYAAGARAGVRDAEDLGALVNLPATVDAADPAALRAAAEAAVAGMKTAKPYLFGATNGQTQTDITTTNGTGRASPKPFDLTRPETIGPDDVRRMSKDQRTEYAKAMGWTKEKPVDRLLMPRAPPAKT